MEKMRDLGWGDELDSSYATFLALKRHPSVNQSRPLTERSEYITDAK